MVVKLFSKDQNSPPLPPQMASVYKSDLVQVEKEMPQSDDALALTPKRHPDLGGWGTEVLI